MKYVIFSILCTLSYVYSANFRVDPLVITEQGLIRGLKASDGSYSSFLGVPYASIDVEEPFGASQRHPGFGDEIFNAYNGLTKCPQSTLSSSEYETLDCLTLNIYSPILASTLNPLPVLVWIHGGDFAVGSAGEYDPESLVRQGIIVVTMNYRLGAYGFMCLDVPNVPGNQGLKDQYEGLLWVRKNIRSFGGNPYNITIAGQDAGSSSVLLHLYSSKEKIFNKVIIESGTPQNIGMFVQGDVDAAQKLASYLGINTTDTDEALSFLAKISPEVLTGAVVELGLELKPCRERSFSSIKNFIENEPFSLSNEKKVRNTPVLIGHTSKEGLKSVNAYGDNYFKTNPFYENIKDNFNLDDDQLKEAAGIVRHFYIGDESISATLKPELVSFESDVTVNHPIQRTITYLLNENAKPIYEYEFSYDESTEATGSTNSEELKYLFKIPGSEVENNEENNLIINRITTLWANFVKYGNPTPQKTDLLPVMWKPITADTRPYIVIDSELKLENRINHDRMAFWDLFYLLYGKYNKHTRDCNI